MSKKELLERISRGPADAKKRAEVAPPGAPDANSARVTAAGGRVVVRRRQKSEPEPVEVAAPTTVVRRRPVEVPSDVVAEVQEDVVIVRAVDVEPEPAPEPMIDEQPEAHQPEPVAVRQPEPEPVAQHPEPVREPEAAPAPPPTPAPAPARAVAARQDAPQRLGRGPAADPNGPPQDAAVPERPRFEGLGKAVVMPPPGYDPTNPGAFRRRVQATPARQPTAAGAAAEEWRRRRGEATPEATPADEADRAQRARRGRTSASVGDGGMAMRRRPRRKAVGTKQASPEKKASKRKIRIDGMITVGQLAHELGVKATIVVKELMGMGRMATVNELLDLDTAQIIATGFEYEVVNAGFQEEQFLQHVGATIEEEGLVERPPVVTIMGHVDHGKTTLLDAIREAKVAAGESGGITQHIGAYQVDLDGDKITFIDTPGHAAFSAMRARGAGVTDIVVLVVAQDDGVQAQTEEAIAHAKAAGVPILVAVNKMDKPGANADAIKQRLSDLGLVPEDWGGDTMYVPVSALKKQGIDELLEAILLQAEVLELKANPDRHAEGAVIEARVERGRGTVATLLVQKGTLKRGDNIVLGASFGRVRAMMDHSGAQLKTAGPATPVEVFGLSELPEVGDSFHVVKSEKDARTLAEHRAEEKRVAALFQPSRRTAADMYAQAETESRKTLPVILRCDVQGSLEALRNALSQITINGTELRFLHAAVGELTESDVNLATSNGALIIGFNVKADAMARQAAERHGVVIEYYSVIYAVIDRVTAAMGGLLGPQYREVKQGAAEIRAVFNISKFGKIAGCYVTDGKIIRNNGVRVLRNGNKIHEGKINTLKRFKEDVREVAVNYECGIGIEGFDDLQVGDVFETFAQEQIAFVAPAS